MPAGAWGVDRLVRRMMARRRLRRIIRTSGGGGEKARAQARMGALLRRIELLDADSRINEARDLRRRHDDRAH